MRGWLGKIAVVFCTLLAACPVGPSGGVRTKGELSLKVYRERNGEVELSVWADPLYEGDEIGFQLNVPFDGHLLVIGRSAQGEVYPVYPLEPGAEAVAVSENPAYRVPGGFELDDSQGEEWFFVIVCPHPFGPTDIGTGDEPGSLRLQSECRFDHFKLNKRPPPDR